MASAVQGMHLVTHAPLYVLKSESSLMGFVESDTTAEWRYARQNIADAAHGMPERAPHARLRHPRPLSPTYAQQHLLKPRISPAECLAHGVPVKPYRST